MEAPKKIWIYPDLFEEVSICKCMDYDVQYIRADIVEDLIKTIELLVTTGLDQYTHHEKMSDPDHYVNVVLEKMRDV